MWTVRFPRDPSHPDAEWGWDYENARPHYYDVTVRGRRNSQRVMLERKGHSIELGRVLKEEGRAISTNWWCFGFYRGHLTQPGNSVLDQDLPLEERLKKWEAFQDEYMERGTGFVTRRKAISHMLYRTGWWSDPY